MGVWAIKERRKKGREEDEGTETRKKKKKRRKQGVQDLSVQYYLRVFSMYILLFFFFTFLRTQAFFKNSP
jgi:cell division septal protein FtsQ